MLTDADVVAATVASYDRFASQYSHATWDVSLFGRLSVRREAFLSMLRGPRVLDAGIGSGRDSVWFAEHGLSVTAVDASQGILDAAQHRIFGLDVRIVKSDLRHLNLRSSGFDGVWCCATLQHIPRRECAAVLQQFNRILCEGGALFVSVPNGDREYLQISESIPAPRLRCEYTQAVLNSRLSDAHFDGLDFQLESVGRSCWLSGFGRKRAIP